MEQINKKRLARNFFSLSIVQGVNALLQLLIVPFVIAKIGVENFGIVAVAQVIMFSLATLAEYGYGQTGARKVSLNRNNTQALSAVFYNSIYTKLFLSAAGFLLLLLLSLVVPVIHSHLALYCLAFVFVPGQASLPSWFFQGMEKMHWSALTVLCSKIIFVILVFLLIRSPEDTPLFTFFLGLGNLAAGIAATVFVIRKYKLPVRRFSFPNIIAELKEGWPVTVTNLTMNFMQYGNLFILRLYTNDLVAGYFSVAERIYFAMKQVVTAFSQTIYPNVCQLAGQNGLALKKYFGKIFVPFFMLTVAATLAVMALAPFIIHFFVPDQGGDSVFILRMLCIALPVVCLNMPGSLSLLALDKTKAYFLVYFSGFVICLLSNFILVPSYQSPGTLAVIYITECFITAGVSVMLFKFFRQQNHAAQPRR